MLPCMCHHGTAMLLCCRAACPPTMQLLEPPALHELSASLCEQGLALLGDSSSSTRPRRSLQVGISTPKAGRQAGGYTGRQIDMPSKPTTLNEADRGTADDDYPPIFRLGPMRTCLSLPPDGGGWYRVPALSLPQCRCRRPVRAAATALRDGPQLGAQPLLLLLYYQRGALLDGLDPYQVGESDDDDYDHRCLHNLSPAPC